MKENLCNAKILDNVSIEEMDINNLVKFYKGKFFKLFPTMDITNEAVDKGYWEVVQLDEDREYITRLLDI